MGGRGAGAGLVTVLDSIGATEPFGMASEGESGPTLDLGLGFCDVGMIERRRIQELREEIESRLVSSPARSCDDESSVCRAVGHLLTLPPLLL